MKKALWADVWVKRGGLLMAAVAMAGMLWVAAQVAPVPAEKPAGVAAMLPQGALLAIESPDFGVLLHDWEASPEQAAWLKSDDYGVFSRSRLFQRLSEAQEEFAGAAGLAPDGAFLSEIAGTDTIFAWYDIGKLEFVYITRLPPGKAEQTRLMQSKSSFSQRQVGGSTFYLRTHGSDQGGQVRTVAFAVSGDYLLLATREDLMANALALIAGSSSNSLATEPWFADARNAIAATPKAPELRMTLDLGRIVKTPYFRSYWVQENVTEMKQYRAANIDLYRDSEQMREERVLLSQSAGSGGPQAELGELVALAPARAAVYRAVATSDAAVAVQALEEKVLSRGPTAYSNQRIAPSADLSESMTGSASDLETRIDATPLVARRPEEEAGLLREQIAAAGITGVLTVDWNQPGEADEEAGSSPIWVPLHSAVVIRATKAWDEGALENGLAAALEPQLSAGRLGMSWTRRSGGYSGLGEVRPLLMAVRGDLLLVADDAAMMEAMLARTASARAPMEAVFVGEFNHSDAAAPFARLARVLDRTGEVSASGEAQRQTPGADERGQGAAPAFFSGDMVGLSESFRAMTSEHVVERRDGPVVRETVTYRWLR